MLKLNQSAGVNKYTSLMLFLSLQTQALSLSQLENTPNI